MLATEAKKIKVFGIVRNRLKRAKVMKIRVIPNKDSVAPMRSTALRVSICASSNIANSRSSASGSSITAVQ